MRRERIFLTLNELDADLLEEAEIIKPKRSNLPLYSLATAASIFLLVGISGYIYYNRPDPSLPKLDVSFYENGGMGFSGYHALSGDDLVNNNPWTEDCELTHLPVFWNNHPVDGAGWLLSYDWEAMDNALIKVANNLGLTDIEIMHNLDSIASPLVYAQSGNVSLEVTHPHLTKVSFKPHLEIPTEYKIPGYGSTYDETYALAECIKEAYPELISMENPVIDISGGEYYSGGDMKRYNISFYNMTEDITQNILNYNFNHIDFTTDPTTGDLRIYWVYNRDLSHVIGNYPIISADEAQKLLCHGRYGTNVPEKFPGEEYIAKRELVYRNDIMQSIFVPYYLFYVELPDEYDSKEGVNCYGLYYVPAVESRYIENFSDVWNIKYN